MKKLFLLLLCFTFVAALLCACQTQFEQNGKPLTTDASTEHTKESTDVQKKSTPEAPTDPEPTQDVIPNPGTVEEPTTPEWKTAYLNFIESKKDSHISFALVYIDDDDIPELYLRGICEAEGDSICSYKNGAVIEQSLKRVGGGRYVEKSGAVINQNGNMGYCYTHVYKLTSDGFALTFSALSVENVEHLGNNEYNISYEYSVENKPVSESEYNAAVGAAFNSALSVRLDENTVKYDVIKQQIMDCE